MWQKTYYVSVCIANPTCRDFGWHFRKLKAQSSNVSFATFQCKETFELWALSFELWNNIRKFHPKWDRLYLVPGMRPFALWVNCLYAPTTPTVHSTTISRFPYNFFPRVAPHFLVIMIHQVIWPSTHRYWSRKQSCPGTWYFKVA